MLGIGNYFWRLVPANPILLRVVEAGGKRRRDLFVRCCYLGLLIVVVLFAILGSSASTGSLADLAKISARMFQRMSYLQLGLVALLAPVFTAGAITQEKDSQTYDILLSTPLSNGQIVLGSLLSRLFFVVALLVSGIPIFSITQIFGGVAIDSIVMSFLIAAATTFVTGALAMAIATFKVGTRRTIFSFYMFIVIYLIGGMLIEPYFQFNIQLSDGSIASSETSWLTGIHPFLALRTLFHETSYTVPNLAELPAELRGWPWGWYLSSPASFYVWFMFLLSLVLILPSIALLRRMAQSTTSIKGWVLLKLKIQKGDLTRKPRGVWNNPIAWREAKTKASAAKASLVRYGFIAAGLVGALALVIMFSRERPTSAYINSSSYDANLRTLAIIEGESAKTYVLSPMLTVQLNGEEANLNSLRGRYAIANKPSIGSQGEITNLNLADIPRQLGAAEARSFLLGAVIVEFAVILLIVTNAAASTVTREKEDGSLDLLLTTPITSRYYIWGKLRGLVSYVMPLVAVPVASAVIFIFHDIMRYLSAPDPSFQWIVFPEAVLILPGLLIIVAAFASIVGMHMSLRCRTTVRAVMSSVGIVMGACGGLAWCGYSVLEGFRAGEPSLVLGSFSPFTILTILIDPMKYGGPLFKPGSDWATPRIIVLIFAWVATGAYALLVWTMYKSMVKNFDMTIRRQSR